MITGLMFKNGIISAANNISNSRQAVDALNIFPVPDGDTGTNMSMTINAAAADIAAMPEDSSLGEVSKRTASALLRGARGNSGVILSLIFRGMSKAFKGLDEAGSKDVAKAFRMGCDAAYKAVMKPTEGTILTVIRKAAEAAEEIADIQDEPLKVCFAALQAAKQALAKTPEQLPVLKKAGVVDAGGQGLVLIFEGIQSVFENNAIVQPIDNEKKEEKQNDKSTVAAADEEIKFGYCSEFLIEKEKSAKLIRCLGQFYRKSVSGGREFLTINEEIQIVKDYADILKIRFGDSFKFDVRLDETCRNFKIPKLTIQPLVENSFQHGIRIQEKYGYIQVNVQRENDKIHISVIDNGQGIPDNIIKEMEEGKVPDEKRSLGLRGTVQRLKVIYEDAFSYEIHNEAMSEIHIYINCNVLGEK